MRSAARAADSDPAVHMRARSSRERKLAACQALYRAYEGLSKDPANGTELYYQLLQAAPGLLASTEEMSSAPYMLQCDRVYPQQPALILAGGLHRLAARLIPKFAHHFPAELEKSVQVLTQLIKAQQAEDPEASTTFQDALQGVANATVQLCKLSPGHAALQRTVELLLRCAFSAAALWPLEPACGLSRTSLTVLYDCRHFHEGIDAAFADSSHKVSSSAAAGLCSLLRAHARSCCLILAQILGKQEDQLVSAVCSFLHQHLLTPSLEHVPALDPDIESCDPDRPSLALEAFEQPLLVQTVMLSAQSLSGSFDRLLDVFDLNCNLRQQFLANMQSTAINTALQCRNKF